MDYSHLQLNSHLGIAFQHAFATWTKLLFDRLQNTAVEDLSLNDLEVVYWFDGADEEGFNLTSRGPSEYTSECSWSNLGILLKVTLFRRQCLPVSGCEFVKTRVDTGLENVSGAQYKVVISFLNSSYKLRGVEDQQQTVHASLMDSLQSACVV